ncbi:MAG: hypothetical protein CBE33_01165 [Candidatus Pelagibacter sp. TMED273]|nr:MAG: hypothetical protein CBE33_01165 [Candidatus Pelagibacter sp. TMED273]
MEKLPGKLGMVNKNFWSKKNILITGSSGLLGSWMVEKLLSLDANLIGIAKDKSMNTLLESKNILQGFKTFYLDISEFSKVEKVFSENEIDITFHLAAQTQVIDALINPLETFKSNIEGTWNLLELSRLFDRPIVVASSDKAYGSSEKLPYKENYPLEGEFPYEVSKSTTDLLSKTYSATYNLPVVTLRCGNIFGGGDLNFDRLIPGVINWLLNNEKPILRTNGDYMREWVYVEDVVNAYLGTGKALLENKNNHSAYNFSSGKKKSVIEIYEILCNKISGNFIEPEFKLSSEKEIKNQELDSSLINDDLNIYSLYQLNESLDETISWYKEYLPE